MQQTLERRPKEKESSKKPVAQKTHDDVVPSESKETTPLVVKKPVVKSTNPTKTKKAQTQRAQRVEEANSAHKVAKPIALDPLPAELQTYSEDVQRHILDIKEQVEQQRGDLTEDHLLDFKDSADIQAQKAKARLDKHETQQQQRDQKIALAKAKLAAQQVQTELEYLATQTVQHEVATEAALSLHRDASLQSTQADLQRQLDIADTQLQRDQAKLKSTVQHQEQQQDVALKTTDTQLSIQATHQKDALSKLKQTTRNSVSTDEQRQQAVRDEALMRDATHEADDQTHQLTKIDAQITAAMTTLDLKDDAQQQRLSSYTGVATRHAVRQHGLTQSKLTGQLTADQRTAELVEQHEAEDAQLKMQHDAQQLKQQEDSVATQLAIQSHGALRDAQHSHVTTQAERKHQLTVDQASKQRDLRHEADQLAQQTQSQQEHDEHHQALSAAQLTHYAQVLPKSTMHQQQRDKKTQARLLKRQEQAVAEEKQHEQNELLQQQESAAAQIKHHDVTTTTRLNSHREQTRQGTLQAHHTMLATRGVVEQRDQRDLQSSRAHEQKAVEQRLEQIEDHIEFQADSAAYTLNTQKTHASELAQQQEQLLTKRQQAQQQTDQLAEKTARGKQQVIQQHQLDGTKEKYSHHAVRTQQHLQQFSDAATDQLTMAQQRLAVDQKLVAERNTATKTREQQHREAQLARQQYYAQRRVVDKEKHTTTTLHHYQDHTVSAEQRQQGRLTGETLRQQRRDAEARARYQQQREEALRIGQVHAHQFMSTYDQATQAKVSRFIQGGRVLKENVVNHQVTVQQTRLAQDAQAQKTREAYLAEKQHIAAKCAEEEAERLAAIEREKALPKDDVVLAARYAKNRLGLWWQGVKSKVSTRLSHVGNYLQYKTGQGARGARDAVQSGYQVTAHAIKQTITPAVTSVKQGATSVWNYCGQKAVQVSYAAASGWNRFWSSAKTFGAATKAQAENAGIAVKNTVVDNAVGVGRRVQYTADNTQRQVSRAATNVSQVVGDAAKQVKKATVSAAYEAGQVVKDGVVDKARKVERQVATVSNGVKHTTKTVAHAGQRVWLILASGATRVGHVVKHGGQMILQETGHGVVFVVHHVATHGQELVTNITGSGKHATQVVKHRSRNIFVAATEPVVKGFRSAQQAMDAAVDAAGDALTDGAVMMFRHGKSAVVFVYRAAAKGANDTSQWCGENIALPVKNFTAQSEEMIHYRGKQVGRAITHGATDMTRPIYHAGQDAVDYVMHVGGQQFIRISFVADNIKIHWDNFSTQAGEAVSYQASNLAAAVGDTLHNVGAGIEAPVTNFERGVSRRAQHLSTTVGSNMSHVGDQVVAVSENATTMVSHGFQQGWHGVTTAVRDVDQRVVFFVSDNADGFGSRVSGQTHRLGQNMQQGWHQTTSTVSTVSAELVHQGSHAVTTVTEAMSDGLQSVSQQMGDVLTGTEQRIQRGVPAVIYPAGLGILMFAAAGKQQVQQAVHVTGETLTDLGQTVGDAVTKALVTVVVLPLQHTATSAKHGGQKMQRGGQHLLSSTSHGVKQLSQSIHGSTQTFFHEARCTVGDGVSGIVEVSEDTIEQIRARAKGFGNAIEDVGFSWRTWGDRRLLEKVGLMGGPKKSQLTKEQQVIGRQARRL